MRIIIDTNVLVALIDEKDNWHNLANVIRNVLKEKDAELVIFDCVINETLAVIGRRLEEKSRLAFRRLFFGSVEVRICCISRKYYLDLSGIQKVI